MSFNSDRVGGPAPVAPHVHVHVGGPLLLLAVERPQQSNVLRAGHYTDRRVLLLQLQ